MTNNLVQLGAKGLQPEAIYSNVIYERSLYGLGRVPSGWTAGFYDNYFREIPKIAFDELQLLPATISDNVMRTFGITYDKENIVIRPCLIELVESTFKESNAAEVSAQVYTELNRRMDILTYEQLSNLATKGTAYTWTSPSDFITWAIGVCSGAIIADLRKHLIIPESIRAKMLSGITNPDHRSWLLSLIDRLAELNTDLIISKVGTEVFLVVEPFLVEYTGIGPHIYEQGESKRQHERWTQYAFSLSDYKLRSPEGLQSFAISGITRTAVPRVTTDDDERITTDGAVRMAEVPVAEAAESKSTKAKVAAK